MLDLDSPDLDWCLIARGMGVEAARADTIEQFIDLFGTALTRKGPFLIEARI
jgi:acetolactate synthase-1/2/3 large subunit